MQIQEEDQCFIPMVKNIPIQSTKYSNNQIYYNHPPQEAQMKSKAVYQPHTRWDNQIKQQPEWMQDLVKYVDYARIDDVMTAIDESDHMIIVSDGSGKDFKMTFRWMMSTPEGEIVAKCCAGHCYGRESTEWKSKREEPLARVHA